MPRQMSSAMLAALSATEIRPAIFVEAAFISETARIWSGAGDISWNGQTWKGLGSLLGFAPTEDAATVEARGIAITFSGFDAHLVSEALTDFRLGLPVTVYFGLFEADRTTLIADPVTTWSGRTDQPTVDIDGTTASLTINCESKLIDMNVSAGRRYTNDDAQIDAPGDFGFVFVSGIQECALVWGKAAPVTSNNI